MLVLSACIQPTNTHITKSTCEAIPEKSRLNVIFATKDTQPSPQFWGKGKSQVSSEKLFACPFCPYTSNRNYNLKIHMQIHTDAPQLISGQFLQSWPKQFCCDYCTYTTCKKSNLKRHFLTHTGEKPFQSRGNNRSRIRRTMHSCGHCAYRTCNSSHFKRHMFVHTGEKPHECSDCNKSFTQKSDLKRHYISIHMK
ncbi:hypothetical protein JTE90_025115 [Oedothorax gibbosus]|uniref:C2H2-type domain-containing protein n=1 Tax=Oedothorax gibbosus TaxID=931172 RepID=A0AAV6U2N6_9ARAC|nr:hypothetical protein JTE90_025115 [Oedothorax gibbosus]